ncbi:MAG TPA: tRNA (adenosine(37)-N6)-threonylcarbamoyltransferase complex ATPase subunit type 1 TsaE, partial [Dermatophilaceae bacterium]|nr:tRNA (adenosine(37)-N6)-threonylcarbamoyltransferase complex ATPase subunit type 1 TsaE [Dermatophilaceae bacterium]
MSPSPGPVTVSLPDADAARVFGLALADLLRAGDVLVLTGDLG